MEQKLVDGFENASTFKNQTTGVYHLINDDILIKFEDTKAANAQLISGLSLNCTDLDLTTRY